ncbi:MAG: hypothetical protein ACREH4_14605 [Vitreimonas sp.]
MIPQTVASQDQPKSAPVSERARARRWPRFWTLLGALAASAALWALIYVSIRSMSGLIGGLL